MAAADQVLTAGLSMVSVLVGYGAKMGQDWWTAKRARQQADEALWSLHRQQLYLPLLGATRELEARLSELTAVYGGTSQGSSRCRDGSSSPPCSSSSSPRTTGRRAGPLRRQGALRGAGRHRRPGPAGDAAGRDLPLELGPPVLTMPQPAAAFSARSRPSRISSSPNAYSFP
jgi:hypothetical protein